MSIQDTVDADAAAVVAAQAALDAAQAKLATDQAALAALQPHLSLLAQIEAEFVKLEDGATVALAEKLGAIRAEVMPLVAQIRELFLA